jgi:FtsH-binding integral membrane protein
VQPPDITTTRGGEKIAGLVTVVLLVAVVVTLFWFMNGRRRWPFVIGQLATLVASVDFIVDSNTGSPAVPIVLALTSAAALVLALLPASGAYVDTRLWLPRAGTRLTHLLHR